MPRPKVDPRFRQRVARACDSCKKRKEKCNGTLPCDQCKTRRIDDKCHYSNCPPPGSHHSVSRKGHSDREVRHSLSRMEETDTFQVPLSKQVDVPVANSSPASQSSHMLQDGRGKFIYVGESASLSFLETVRNAVQIAIGPCAFTEPPRNPMIESTPPITLDEAQEPVIGVATARSLACEFFRAVSGALDLFDPPWLIDQVHNWFEPPSHKLKSNSKPKSALVYLAVAIGLQGRANGEAEELLAEQCFAYGRKITMFYLMDDPSLTTVQAVMMITYYMIAACRYNAAFTNLGVAVRAAYALGIHLHETNTALGGAEGLYRERAWKSLRVCDLFLSASLGRPPATSEAVSNISWAPVKTITDCISPGVSSQVFSAMFRICNVFERVLVEVYAEKAVSLELARSISAQHRQWTEELPRMLLIDGLEDSDALQDSGTSPRSCGISPRAGAGIVTMAYYYSIVLLTRPFLTFQIRQLSEKTPQEIDSPATKASLETYADACVSSAIRGIDIAFEYVFELNTPKRQPLVVNSVFISALCIGLAYLDTSDRQKWPLDPSLDRAITILAHLGEANTQSARFAETCQELKEAANIYTARRDDTLLQSNETLVRSIFGDLRASSKPQYANYGTAGTRDSPRRTDPNTDVTEESANEHTITPPFDFNSIQEQSMLPTSGVLSGHDTRPYRNFYTYDTDVGGAPLRVTHHPTDSLPDFFSDPDVPLFPLMNNPSLDSCFWPTNN